VCTDGTGESRVKVTMVPGGVEADLIAVLPYPIVWKTGRAAIPDVRFGDNMHDQTQWPVLTVLMGVHGYSCAHFTTSREVAQYSSETESNFQY
jgi:hypothetical protein